VRDYDLASIVAYTLNACIEACSSMSSFAQQRNGTTPLCSPVSFRTYLSDNLPQYADCWLKYGSPRVTGNRKLSATAMLDLAAGGADIRTRAGLKSRRDALAGRMGGVEDYGILECGWEMRITCVRYGEFDSC